MEVDPSVDTEPVSPFRLQPAKAERITAVESTMAMDLFISDISLHIFHFQRRFQNRRVM